MNMFRYLKKYMGTYRVKAYYDLETEDFPRDEDGGIDESFDDLYIPCQKGEIRHTYRPHTLFWYTDSIGQGRNLKREIDEKYKGKFEYEYEETDSDVMIYFKEDEIKKIATLVKPRTSGASIPPFSPKNLPKVPYEMPERDLRAYAKIVESLDQVDKMQFAKKCISDFDEVIQTKKGKRYNLTKERNASRLKPKLFIHSIGMWEDYLKFVQTRFDEEYGTKKK